MNLNNENQESVSNYYYIDAGEDMGDLAIGIYQALVRLGNHVVLYCTDQPKELNITLLTEDEFLHHYSK